MDILKGNFTTKKKPNVDRPGESLEDKFEREALKRLGGSIAYVSKKKFLWTEDNDSEDNGSEF